jgi:protein SCO1/2
MSISLRSLLLTLIITGLIAACSSPETIYDLSDDSYSLLNTDSTTVNFPGDFKGDISVITFIYTNCPDVCPVITANMTNIQRELQDTVGINFIEISFDPERDTPSVLKNYKNVYKLNEQFTFLTADTATINTLLDKLEIVAEKAIIDSLGQDSSNYSMMHSNTIYLMDEQGRIRAEYMGSAVPPEHVIEDIQTLRNE